MLLVTILLDRFALDIPIEGRRLVLALQIYSSNVSYRRRPFFGCGKLTGHA
jgi:hypothetical protein